VYVGICAVEVMELLGWDYNGGRAEAKWRRKATCGDVC
jgi:hypothetical protein